MAITTSDIVQRSGDAFAAGDFDTLAADCADDMIFVMPGQNDVLEGRAAFRAAVVGLGDTMPSGFEITGLRHIEGDDEVVSIVEWKSAKVASSELSVLFKFRGDKIHEERWFVDTEQWRAAL